jgi:hypothetical protein
MAAVEEELTAIKAAFVESLIMSDSAPAGLARWAPASEILWLLKER